MCSVSLCVFKVNNLGWHKCCKVTPHTFYLLDSERQCLLILELEDESLTHREAKLGELFHERHSHMVRVVGFIGRALLLQEIRL